VISKISSLTLCLIFSLALSACAGEQLSGQKGIVTWVYDGDTLAIDPVGKVRLIGIDTPERESSRRDRYLEAKGVPAKKQRQVYQAAKEFNIKHAKGQSIILTPGDPPRDRHDRLLAYVYLPDGRLLNRVLIEQGLAVVYRRFEFRMKEDFLAAETQARQTQKGLWANTAPPVEAEK
jgi:micrococcal nuclease